MQAGEEPQMGIIYSRMTLSARGSALESCPVPLTSTVHLGEGGVWAAAHILLLRQVPAEKQFLDVWSNVKANKKKEREKKTSKACMAVQQTPSRRVYSYYKHTWDILTLGFQNEHESVWFALRDAHTFACTLIAAPHLPATLQEWLLPLLAKPFPLQPARKRLP